METTRDCINDWLRGPVKRLAFATQKQYGSFIQDLPKLAEHPQDLTSKTIRRHFRSMADTPVKANRWKSIVSSFCAWLVEEEIIDANPAAGIRKNPERPSTDFLTESDLVDLAGGMTRSEVNPSTLVCLQIILSTGVRVSEAVGIRWEEVHMQPDGSAEWHIPATRTKAGRPLITRLPSRVALQMRRLDSFHIGKREGPILKSAKDADGVLTGDAVRQSLRRICVKMDMFQFTPHDLRRTVGTLLAKHGIHVEVRKALLNHAPSGVTDIHYNQYDYWQEKVAALKTLEELLIKADVI